MCCCKLFTGVIGICHTSLGQAMFRNYFPLFSSVILFYSLSVEAIEFYEKPEIQGRMEKREVISVVKVVSHETNPKLEVLKMDAAGVVDGVSVPRAMKLMVDYENLQRIAPDYIKLSELIVKKIAPQQYKKYLHLKTEVKTLLMTYRVETYTRVTEEETPDEGIVHWEIVPAKELKRKASTPENFVGLKGKVVVKKYQRSSSTSATRTTGRGTFLNRAKKDQVMSLFKGELVRKDMSKIVPNFILQFAMEVALQRVGVLLRNYLETAKEEPKQINLEAIAEPETHQPATGSE